jgi:glycosyltransferase involved in cell wall biosynthesis
MRYKICAVTTISKTMDWFLVDTMRFLSENDFEVTLICDMEDGFIDRNSTYAKLIPLSMSRGIDPIGAIKAIYKMYKIFKRENFDLIQYATPNAALYASIASLLVGTKLRVYSQWGIRYTGFSGIKKFVFKMIEKFTCMLSTEIQPDSFGNLNLSIKDGLYKAYKGSVIWNGSANGVNLKKFDISKKTDWRMEIRSKYNISEDEIVFGFVGRLDKDKGINELFESFRNILIENPSSHLVMVGRVDKASTLNQSLYEWSQNEPQIIYCGETFNVEKYLAATDIFVLPSYREGFGTSVIEAEAMEVPVIVTDIRGPIEAMLDKQTGLVVKKKNALELTEAMISLMNYKNTREEMGKKGLAFVTENFESNKLFKYILEDRKRLLKSN